MPTHRNRIRPDTHPDTWIEYEWDDADPNTHTPVAARLLGVDQPPGQLVAAMNKVYGEARRKSYSIADLIAYLQTSEQVQKNVEDVKWELNSTTGSVTITVSGLTTQQANRARNALNAKYGNTVVLVTV